MGRARPFGNAETARALVGRMPNVTLEILPGAGHAPWLDDLPHAIREVGHASARARDKLGVEHRRSHASGGSAGIEDEGRQTARSPRAISRSATVSAGRPLPPNSWSNAWKLVTTVSMSAASAIETPARR